MTRYRKAQRSGARQQAAACSSVHQGGGDAQRRTGRLVRTGGRASVIAEQVDLAWRGPVHFMRRHALREQLARCAAPVGERRGKGATVQDASCSAGNRLICCGASDIIRRSDSDGSVSRCGR